MQNEKQNKDYGKDIQQLYLEIMLTDAETFIRCQSIFDSTLFDRELRLTAEFIQEYVTNYNSMPTFDMVNASTQSKLKNPGILQSPHYDWLLEEFETFTRHRALEKAIIKSADLLEAGEYGTVESLIKDAVQIGLQKDLGMNYWADPTQRLEEIKNTKGQIATGWATLDHMLYGGFQKGELEIFAGSSGSGKSIFLANLGVNWALAGLNVLYVTLELSEGLVAKRMDSMVTGVSTQDVLKKIDDVALKVSIAGKSAGAYQVKYMPSGTTINNLRSFVKEYEIKHYKKFDVIIVDYLDLMMPASKRISPENLFVKDKYISEELRNLGMEINALMVSASQLNRSGVDEIEYDHSNISGGLSKINTADNVAGIFTSRAMRERGEYQLQLMKTRNSSGVGSKISLDFDVNTLRITDTGKETESDSLSNYNDIATAINRNTTEKPSIDSSKLREFLKSSNNEV